MFVKQPLSRWILLAAVGLAAVASMLAVASRDAGAGDFPVAGQFVLWDDFPAYRAGDLCDAKRSFYYDINSSTPVRAENLDGVEVAATTLGDGRILSDSDLSGSLQIAQADLDTFRRANGSAGLQACLFTFSFEVAPGSDHGEGYVVTLGNRGRWQMSEDQLQTPGALQWSLGLR